MQRYFLHLHNPSVVDISTFAARCAFAAAIPVSRLYRVIPIRVWIQTYHQLVMIRYCIYICNIFHYIKNTRV